MGAETHAELHSSIEPAIIVSHPPRSDRALGVVLAGGKWTGPKGPDMSKSSANGDTLAPFDPFRIEKWHSKRLARRQERKQHKVNLESQLEALKATAERTKRRLAQEAIEIAEEKARAAAEAEAEKKKNFQEVEAELMEVSASTETNAETESEMLAELAAEAAVDAEQEAAQELEAEADAEEEAEDLASAEADIEAGFEVDVDAEFNADADSETESETDSESAEDDDALLAELSASDPAGSDRPSDYVTYGREDLIDETFNNGGGRAVFARRQRGQEIVRFEKTTQSSGGNAVVNGVTKLPCGKEITDKGLFAAAVSENLGATVEAANPEAPVRVDENIAVVRALPVVPEHVAQKGLDEYGDADE